MASTEVISNLVPLAATLGPVALMVIGGWFATRSARPERQS